MDLLKSQLQSRKLLDNVSMYIGELVTVIEKFQNENNGLKKQIEDLKEEIKRVSTQDVGGSRPKGKPKL